MRSLRIFFVFMAAAAVTTGLPFPAPASEEAWDTRTDFKFLELQRELRDDPRGPHSRANLFAVGEYYFHENDPEQAAEHFRRFGPSDPQDPEDLVAMVYLVRCAVLAKDVETASALEKKLQDALSSKHFFVSFDEKHVQPWNSPLGNRFDFRESVDRLEILINGSPFYTINL